MARNNVTNTLFSIIGLIVIIVLIAKEALNGNFTPILIVLGIIGAIFIFILILKISSTEKKESSDESRARNLKPYVIVGILLLGTILHIYLNNDKPLEHPPVEYIAPAVEEIAEETKTIQQPKTVSIINQTFYNCNFQIPDNLSLDNNLSSDASKVYMDYTSNLSLTLNVERLPENNQNKSIDDFADNLKEYAGNLNENNQIRFNDFTLVNYEISNLGNIRAFEIKQTSTKVSGTKNIEMLLTTYNVLANPYYYSITFSYPKDSIKYKEVLNDINNSFIFETARATNQNLDNLEIGYYSVIENLNHRVYFYESPDTRFPRKSYLVGKELVLVEKIINDFGYINFTNPRGLKSSGWINLYDLVKSD